jgi:hypothetical protein
MLSAKSFSQLRLSPDFGVAARLSHGGFRGVIGEFGDGLGLSRCQYLRKPKPALETIPDGVRTSHKVASDPTEDPRNIRLSSRS